jgi:hypothetical protein
MHLSVVQRGESVANSARHDQCYSSDVVKRHENPETVLFQLDGGRLDSRPFPSPRSIYFTAPCEMLGSIID